mmetsp:Transcript_8031/g.21476  ORF Transcript_8031/g.21476 Transcript_8031/m.21476 type:complete len:451 (+) Transcript_8031:84-1436(+)
MRPHLALCLVCAVVSGKRTKKTRQPTTAPVPAPTPAPVGAQTAASESTHATLLYENASCEGGDQGTNLGTPASVDECAASAAAAGCDMFMFSESYGYAWGCRCCAAKTQYHNNWSIYSIDSKNSLRTTPRPTTAPTSAHSCPTGYVADCEGSGPGGHCCPERWLGNGDCDDHYEFMKHCDLTCYDNDGGDCAATTPGPTPEPTPEPTAEPTLAPTPKPTKPPEEPTPVVRGSLTLSGITSADRATPVLRGAIAGVAGVPADAVRIIGIQTQRRHLRRRLEASTVVVDYEVEATDSEAVARKLAETTPAEFDTVIQDVAAAAGTGAAFKDVRTEEMSVAGAEASDEEEAEDDDASTSKFASVKFIASVAAGCFCLAAALAVRWCLLHRRGKKTRAVVIEYPRLAPIKERPGAPVAYARPVASAPPLAPLAPEPPLASIKERALAEAAQTEC